MLFTIAIPTFNNEKTIEKAILSCLNQDTEQDYEVLLSDDGSKDGTWGIIQKYSQEYPNINAYLNESGSNLWMNHNRCMELAKGDYILFCHAGDELYPNALMIIQKKLEQRNFPNKYVLWGHSIYKDFQWRLRLFGKNLEEKIIGETAYKIFVDGGLTPSGTCYSRRSFLDCGGIINDEKMIFPHADSMTMLKLAFSGFGFEMINDMYFYREKTSTLHLYKKNNKQREEAEQYMLELLKANFNDYELEQIGEESCNVNFIYAYYIYRLNNKYKRKIKKLALKKMLQKPTILIRNGYLRKIIMSY